MKIKNNILVEVKNNEIKNGEFIMPKSITSIGECAFYNCSNLTSITIPASVTSIRNSAFFNCNNLTSIYYMGDIASWCGITFGNYSSNPLTYAHNLYIDNELIKEIVIPDTVKGIKKYAFSGWNGTSITIPDSVMSIGDCAFSSCSSLTNITIGNGVTSIGEYAFNYCSSLQYNEYDNGYYLGNDNNPYIILVKAKNTSITSCKIHEDTKLINHGAFCRCNSLTSITIPDNVTSIGDDAFDDCSSLTSIVIPSSVTNIGNYTFYNCINLMNITIPSSVTRIGIDMFYDCRSLTSITIPDSVMSIGSGAFYNCYHLVEVYNKSSLNIEKGSSNYGYIGYYAKAIYTEEYTSKLSTDSNGYIIYTDGEDKILIGYTGEETELTLPEGVTEIYQYAFYGNNKITSVTIPDSVTSIGYEAFEYCRSLTSITIPDSVMSIEESAFEGCDSLKSKKLNYKAFRIENGKLFCRNKEYKTDKRNFIRGELELCNNGIHYCTNLFEIFNYYWGEIDKDITIYEVQPDSKILKDDYSSKCCTNSIKLVKRLYKEDIIKILNGGENVID